MKILLTSAGIKNDALAEGLQELVGKPLTETKIVFIITPANRGTEDKSWLINNLIELKNQNFKSIDVIDIAGLPENLWKPHLEVADVICFSGGDETYLSRILIEQNVKEILLPLLETRVYMGISAGSMVAGIFLPDRMNKTLFEEDFESDGGVGMEFYNFAFIPHLNSTFFKNVRKEVLDEKSKSFTSKTIATDDQTAVKIDGRNISFIGGGDHWEFVE